MKGIVWPESSADHSLDWALVGFWRATDSSCVVVSTGVNTRYGLV